MDLDLNMRVDENEMPKTFTTDEFLSMSLVEHSGVAVDVGDLGGLGPSAGGKKRTEPEGGKRCKCGSTEHQKISNKECPLYKPRLKLVDQPFDRTERTVTTSTGLNSDTMDLDLKMRVDENEIPKIFTTEEFLSMSMVEHSGVAVDVGDSSGIGPSVGGKKRKEPEGGKPCKCGSTERQRISNKNCPLYKPRLKLQYRDTELPEKTVTTINGLNSVLRIAPLNDIIIDAVAGCTDIQVEASRLLNGYVIWMIEENRPIPDLRFSDGIMREFYQAVYSIDAVRNPHQHKIVSTPSINEYMDEIYSRCRPDHLAWNDATKLAQLISNMARMHSTNCQNHKWSLRKLGKQSRASLSADDFNEVLTVAMNDITRTEEDDGFYAIPLNIIEAGTSEQLNLIYDRINHYYEKLRIILNNQPLDEDSLKASWWTYLKPMSRLLKTFINNYEQDAPNRLENGIHGRGLRLFSLIPISTFKQKPIAAPSANTSTKASPTHYKHVLMDMNGKINMIMGVEDMCEYGLESTVIDCVNFDHPVILRPGGVTLESIQAVKGYENTTVYKGTMSKPSTPGMKYKHYAPQHAQVVMINYEQFESKLNEIISSNVYNSIGVYRFYDVHIKQSQYDNGTRIVDHKVDSLKEYGKYLFHAFRVFDEVEKVECIVTHTVPLEDEGRAIMNRLQKAATQLAID
ncbi:hypothetical protein MP638_003276 [Amoeboaphelidium occidentale]|nr:hypothetical protein MP638_003276 [Amoeboaphelidium occidentale]